MAQPLTETMKSPFQDGRNSQTDSWGTLADPEPVADLPPSPESKPDSKPGDAIFCLACGEEIERKPGARGRKPKYHPDCKPSGATAEVRTKRVGSAQSEADEIVKMVKSGLTKLAMMVAVADKYDAFVIMVNLGPMGDQLRATLIRYPNIRKQLLDAKGTGSAFGLVVSILMVLGPIAAHHGLLPFKSLAPILVNAPKSMFAIQQQLKDGEQNLARVMQEQMSAMNGKPKAGANAE
jgi:hypothetical protein